MWVHGGRHVGTRRPPCGYTEQPSQFDYLETQPSGALWSSVLRVHVQREMESMRMRKAGGRQGVPSCLSRQGGLPLLPPAVTHFPSRHERRHLACPPTSRASRSVPSRPPPLPPAATHPPVSPAAAVLPPAMTHPAPLHTPVTCRPYPSQSRPPVHQARCHRRAARPTSRRTAPGSRSTGSTTDAPERPCTRLRWLQEVPPRTAATPLTIQETASIIASAVGPARIAATPL
jgi:hypothetical protein